jgi:hypothetical protein
MYGWHGFLENLSFLRPGKTLPPKGTANLAAGKFPEVFT